MLRDTIAPTELRAGVRANVVPSEGFGQPEHSPAAGQFDQDVLEQMQKAVNDPQIKFDGRAGFRTESRRRHRITIGALPDHRASRRRSNFPAPSWCRILSTGATDSAYLRLHNVQSYGLVPFPLTEADYRCACTATTNAFRSPAFAPESSFSTRTVHDFVATK